jgi:hypothetical protein
LILSAGSVALEVRFVGVVGGFEIARDAACDCGRRPRRCEETDIIFCLASLSTFLVVLGFFVGVVGAALDLHERLLRFLPSTALLISSEEDEESAPAKSSEESEASEGLGKSSSARYSFNLLGFSL